MHETRASVIIPVHNGAEFIRRSVGSALTQTVADIEVIVVDDASTDDTRAIVERCAASDPRVRLIASRVDRGPSASRNLGLSAARGRWAALLDADDWYAAERIEKLQSAGEAAGADMVCDDLNLYDEASNLHVGPMFGAGSLPEVIDSERFVLGNLPNPSQPRRGYGFLKPLVRREFLKRHHLSYDEGMRFSEDYAFYVQALLAGARWTTIPMAMYFYALRESSLTAGHGADELFRLCAFDEAALARAGTDVRLRRALKRHLVSSQKRAAWARFIDLFKERDVRALLRTAAMSGPVFAHISGQCLKQAALRSRRALLTVGSGSIVGR